MTTLRRPGEDQLVSVAHAHRVLDVMGALKAVRTFVASELKEGLDYGVIPGTGTKPTLYQPGAQKVVMYFNAYPRYQVQPTDLGDGHVEYIVTVALVHRADGQVIGSGIGSCSTMESKYRYRNAERVCPHCRKAAIIKGKAEYGGGWVCFKKRDGCGARFRDGDPAIESQESGQVETTNIHDKRNTVLKIAKKRALVDAAMSLGCMSDLFTQDLEDVFNLSPDGVPDLQDTVNATSALNEPGAIVVAEVPPLAPAPRTKPTKNAAQSKETNGHGKADSQSSWQLAVEYGVDRAIEIFPLEEGESRKRRFQWLRDRLVDRLQSKRMLEVELLPEELSASLQRVYERNPKRFQATVFDLAKHRPEAVEAK